jgi:hypothetical protein
MRKCWALFWETAFNVLTSLFYLSEAAKSASRELTESDDSDSEDIRKELLK